MSGGGACRAMLVGPWVLGDGGCFTDDPLVPRRLLALAAAALSCRAQAARKGSDHWSNEAARGGLFMEWNGMESKRRRNAGVLIPSAPRGCERDGWWEAAAASTSSGGRRRRRRRLVLRCSIESRWIKETAGGWGVDYGTVALARVLLLVVK
nr:unnamed protein product [Digitaria exilis]